MTRVIRLVRNLLAAAWSDLWGVAAFLVVAGSSWVFAELVDEVLEGEAHAFDNAVLLLLRIPGDLRDPVGPQWLEDAVRDVTALGSTAVLTLITLGAIGYLAMVGNRVAAVLLAVSVGGGTALGHLLKILFGRPRPDVVPHAAEVLTLSFPSSHAMMSAVVFLTVGVLLAEVHPHRRVKAYLLGMAVLISLLVGASRIYLGVHWPTDVLAGWCLGAAWAIGCWMAARWLKRRRRL